ncbi:MAG: DUF6794 domain-containing protein [Pedobacter sp.]|uniref:DUF6794 domain-containing protein n=1 Tax=Pedobacter sp. TaxID=1411316 RepID=UPI003563F8EA
MKIKYLLIWVLFLQVTSLFSQTKIPITETFSMNGKYSLKSIAYSNEHGNTLGKSIVQKGKKVLYEIDRSFDVFSYNPIYLTISNDGKTIAYFTENSSAGPGFKNVSIYKNGKLLKTYTQAEFTSCDPEQDNCRFLYDNTNVVFDYKKNSKKGLDKVRKEGVSEQELFLNANSILNHNDIIYFTDAKKIVTVFDLKRVKIIAKTPFDSLYHRLKNYKRVSPKFDDADFSYERINDFKFKNSGQKLSDSIGEIAGLKFVSVNETGFFKYKIYRIQLTGYLDHKGHFEIEMLKCDKNFDESRIRKLITESVFESGFISDKIEKQHFKSFFGGFRNPNDSLALEEKESEKKEQAREFERRLSMDSVNHVYIPANMEECMVELDKVLNPNSKKQILAYKSRGDMLGLHHGLGMWIRNNWGLWGGSRLLKYFRDRGPSEPDGLSSMILYNYYDWLKGNKNIAAEWEMKTSKK